MDYREIKENKLKFDSYVEDRFVLMGKRIDWVGEIIENKKDSLNAILLLCPF